MKKHHPAQSGFTLIETLIAVLILALTIGALLTLTAGGFFSIRYAKNDIVASNLLQESLEYIRNDRDTWSQGGYMYSDWKSQYAACFLDDGCMINPYAQSSTDRVVACDGSGCERVLYFPVAGFYGYNTSNYFDPLSLDTQPYETSFVRSITMEETTGTPDPEVIVTAHMKWLNGTNTKSTTQSIILSRWNLQ